MQRIDSDIIRKCQEGDKNAFRHLVESCQGMVYSLALKMLANTEDARDAVQETFVRVWQNIGSFDGRSSLTTWIYTIASRLCLDRLRKMRLTSPDSDDARVFELIADDANPERELEVSEWVSVIKVIAGGLGDKQRLVFTLSQLEGLDNDEITRITGLDAEQIKSNLYAARKNIREQLIKMGYDRY